MPGLFRAGGNAAASLMLASLFASPARAADVQIPLTRSIAPAPQISAVPTAPAAIFQPGAPSQLNATSSNAVPAPAPVRPLTLQERVMSFVDYRNQDAEQLCLAKAVYFEARSESLEGQLAVAEVILNRAASGIYPTSICGVVTQRSQFSFIRAGRFPRVDTGNPCWHKALAIAEVAQKKLIRQIAPNVLWYHASYVAPAWKRNLTRFVRIGMHIFYS